MPLVVLFMLIMLPTSTFFTLTLCESKPMIARLIYHSSKLSRFYNATATVEDLARRETDISFERLSAFNDYHQQLPSSLITRSSNDDDDSTVVHMSTIDANITAPPKTPLFMVVLYIGDREVYETLFLDTGSSLLWVFCSRPGDYEAWRSTSYGGILCGMPSCSASGLGICEGRNGMPCSYHLQYGTGYSEGVLAREKFKFRRSGPVIPSVLFGCTSTATVPSQIEYDGILGIGPRSTSIIMEKGYYGFSYCLGNLSDPYYLENILIIWNTGTPALDSLYSTPLLLPLDSYYGAQLVDIGIASELLPIPFPEGLGLAVFDTGTSDTHLTEEVYQLFEEAIIYAIGDRLDRSYDYIKARLCYKGNLQRDLQWFPTISFHFRNDTFMDVGHEHLFIQQSSNVICLAVLPREDTRHTRHSANIIGARMQLYFYVSYNLLARQLNIKRFDCKNVTTNDDML